MNKFLLLVFGCICYATSLPAQNTSDIVVPITVTTTTAPASITLSFPAVAGGTNTFLGRKLLNQTAWSFILLQPGATMFTDVNVLPGIGFEYIVIQESNTPPVQRVGLVYAGIEVLATAYRGKMILVVDDVLSSPLAMELDRLVQDLRGDGWQVLRRDIDVAAHTVPTVKALIKGLYDDDPDNTVAGLLFGNIPVPYSGNINPDGRPDHLGAWPTDYYYSDMDDAAWTDTQINNTSAARPANHNVPGDGKFDQSQTPTLAEIVVSRVDFSNLSGWDVSQTELYRRYLNKNHNFRTGAYKPGNNTLIDDNLGYFGGEAFAQNGWRNGQAITGVGSIVQGDFFTDTDNQSFLIGYGCGDGNYMGANGVGNSTNFKNDSVNIVFSMLYGHYFGDWDFETNPFLPSALASKGGILATSWAGRPNWHLHHMALGEPILTSTFWVWLNSFLQDRVYPPNFGDDLIHVGMLGDPTLRAHAVAPPDTLVAMASCDNVNLTWKASSDAVLGYLVYRSPSLDSIFEIIVNTPVLGTTFTDTMPLAGMNYYQVKSYKLETVPTGSYYNQSIGTPASVDFNTDTLSATAVPTPVSCNGLSDGAIDLSVSGGAMGTNTFLWSNSSTMQNQSGLNAGTYTVTVTSAQGCTTTASATVTEPSAIDLNTSPTNVLCFGETNGQIDLDIQGGTPGYTFEWSDGSTGQSLADVPAGTYTVTATDANGCTETATETVNEPAAIDLTLTPEDAACNGASNGSVNLDISGGTPGFIYAWSNGANTQNLSDVPAGTYTVTATDANGCAETSSAGVGEPTAITTTTTVTNAGCAGATNGGIELDVSGGTPGYTFEWSNGSTDQNLSNVAAGTYTVTITDDNGCTESATDTVNESGGITMTLTPENATCNGLPNGNIGVDIQGGTPNFSYAWSNGSTDQNLSNVPAGTYTVTATDANGCSQSAMDIVTEPAAIDLGLTPESTTCNGLSNGNIELDIQGGTPGYSFEWSDGSTGQNLTDVPGGTYTVTATDANGCTETAMGTVNEPAAIDLTLSPEDAACNGASNGNVQLDISGGTPGFSYAWSNGASTQNLSNVPAGTYTVTATDAKGCAETSSATVGQPSAISSGTTVTNAGCAGANNGGIELTVSGGTPGYTFEWSDGSTDQNLSNVAAGTYTVTISDDAGCTQTASATVGQQSTLTVDVIAVAAPCFGVAGGSAAALADGGDPDYTYLWSNSETTLSIEDLLAGTYTVTVTDAAGCTQSNSATVTSPPAIAASGAWEAQACMQNTGTVSLNVSGGTPGYFYEWSTGATTKDLPNVAPDIYTVTITDANGCSHTATNSIVQPPPALEIATVFVQTSCPDAMPVLGKTETIVDGGTPGYTYLWSNGAMTTNLQNVPSGIYTVTVTDANGCTKVATTDTFIFIQPWSISNTVTPVTCPGGSDGAISLSVSGAVGPDYSYLWSDGSTTKNISSLSGDVYMVTITDGNGCTTKRTISVGEPLPISVLSINITDADCTNDYLGTIELNAISGGSSPFTYLWSNGITELTNANILAGTYTMTITDSKGCTNTSEYTIELIPFSPLLPPIEGNDTTCVDVPQQFSMPVNFALYEWSVSDSGAIFQGQGTSQVQVVWPNTGPHTLTLVVTNSQDCQDTTQLQVYTDICIGTKEPTLPGVRLQPNPFSDRLSILFDRPVQAGARLRLLDIQGRLILENTALTETTRLETSALPAGSYVLQIVENGRFGVWKVVKY